MEKLRYCNLSLTLGAPFDFLQIERTKRSIIKLELAIALSEMGQERPALEAFLAALVDARKGDGSWEEELHRRMMSLKNKQTRDLWVSVLFEDTAE